MSEQVDQKQRVLKIIVIVLGILIVIALGVIVAGMAMQAQKLDQKKAAEAAEEAPPAQAEVLGNVDVPIPYGARVVGVTAGGGELQVLLDLPEGRALMLVDRTTGEVMGALRFVPGAAPAAPAAP